MMVICPYCGQPIPEGASSCGYCGTPLPVTPPVSAAPISPAPAPQMPPAPQPIPAAVCQPVMLSPIAAAIKRIGSSSLFFMTALCFTLYTVLNSISAFLSEGVFSELVRCLLSEQGLSVSLPFSYVFSIAAKALLPVFNLLIVIGMWIFYAQCKNPYAGPRFDTGIKVAQVACRIRLVLTITAAVICAVLLTVFTFLVALESNFSIFSSAPADGPAASAVIQTDNEYGGDDAHWREFWNEYGDDRNYGYDYGPDGPELYGDAGQVLFAAIIFMFCIGFFTVFAAFEILYIVKILKSLKAVREGIGGDYRRKVSMLMIVFFFIMAISSLMGIFNLTNVFAFSGVTLFYFISCLIQSSSALLLAATMILLAAVFLKYRSERAGIELQDMMRASVQSMMPPQPMYAAPPAPPAPFEPAAPAVPVNEAPNEAPPETTAEDQ